MKKLIIYLFISLTILILIMEYGINSIVGRLFEEKINRYYGSLVNGFVSMMIRDLENLPEDKWQDYMKNIQKDFDYPVSVEKTDASAMSKFERKILNTGKILVSEDGNIFRRKVGTTDYVLIIGPFPELDIEGIIEIVALVLVCVMLLLFSLFWALSFWRNLYKISNTATLLGKGELEARIHVSRRSYFMPIATAFNSMAERIKTLINSHKDLTSGVAHELRTPLARIRFEIEAAESASSKEGIKKHLADIRTDVNELDELTSELLSYALFEREQPAVNVRDYNIVDWFNEYNHCFRNENINVEIDFTIDRALKGAYVKFDGRLIDRVLSNLIQNALKHAESKVRIHLYAEDQFFCFAVEDDGPGIPRKEREKVFTPFTRLDSSRNRNTGGYGLGLAIVKKIVEIHSGNIGIDASPLGGARLVVKIPRLKSTNTS